MLNYMWYKRYEVATSHPVEILENEVSFLIFCYTNNNKPNKEAIDVIINICKR